MPDVLQFGRIAHDAGADGLTLHPRPDERHIRRADVFAVAELICPWRPAFELNIEGYPEQRLLDLVRAVAPEQCTLVPDAPAVLTSEEGWKLEPDQSRLLAPAIAELRARAPASSSLSSRTRRSSTACATPAPTASKSIPAAMPRHFAPAAASAIRACAATAARAADLGMTVNIGHDLNLDNLPPLVAALPAFAEASIGHELTADALIVGFAAAVGAYKAALEGRSAPTSGR